MKEKTPVVALVGRPNVGKSRLFNRFVRSRKAIVENTPGVTRDRNYGSARWNNARFIVIDTGGFEPDSSDVLLEQMRTQAQLAVEEADVILFVVDARAGLLPADQQIAEILRRSNKRVILVVNKIDQPKHIELSYEFYELAFEEMIPISAEHGLNFDDLTEAVTRDFPKTEEDENKRAKFQIDNDFGEFTEKYYEEIGEYPKGYDPYAEIEADEDDAYADEDETEEDEAQENSEDAHYFETREDAELYEVPATDSGAEALAERVLTETINVAVLGKPNTGKSTLINRLLGYNRLLTADIAGTTRDTIDSEVEGKDGQKFVLIDTAGIRRKCTISQRIEKFSIIKALDAVERADVVLLVVDAQNGVTDQDLKIASLAVDRGCAVAVLLNKWDKIENKTDQTAKEYIDAAPACRSSIACPCLRLARSSAREPTRFSISPRSFISLRARAFQPASSTGSSGAFSNSIRPLRSETATSVCISRSRLQFVRRRSSFSPTFPNSCRQTTSVF